MGMVHSLVDVVLQWSSFHINDQSLCMQCYSFFIAGKHKIISSFREKVTCLAHIHFSGAP